MQLQENPRGKFAPGKARRAALTRAVAAEYGNVCGVVVLKAGETAYRQAFHGYDMAFPFHMASLTKSVLSALVGIAAERGYLPSTDEKIMSFFPEYAFETPNPARQEAAIQDLLNMAVPFSFPPFQEPLEEFSRSRDWVRFALEHIDPNRPIGGFHYSTQGAHLLSAILTRATGKSACEFANEALFRPAGMSSVAPGRLTLAEMSFDTLLGKDLKGWANDPQGNSTGGWGLTLTPDDMARFGQLYLEEGRCNGKQIVPPQWAAACRVPNPNRYACLWWQFSFEGVSAFAALGDGGNMVCCVPEKELMVAVASAFAPHPKDRCLLMREHILPLFA